MTIGDSRPSLSPATTGGDDLFPTNFDFEVDKISGDKNSGDESLLSRRSCWLEPASGDEFLMLPIESDSSVAELDSSTLQAALSAISETRKVQPINIYEKLFWRIDN